jgi:hypothetical protein
MGDYLRTTREGSFDSLNSNLAAAIRNHIESYALGDVVGSALICCETTSIRSKKSLLGDKVEVTLTDMILTPQWLIWALRKDSHTFGVFSARLREIHVQDYEQSDRYRLVQDTGLNLSGLRADAVDLENTFLGLGPEPAAQRFRALLKQAVVTAQPDLYQARPPGVIT